MKLHEFSDPDDQDLTDDQIDELICEGMGFTEEEIIEGRQPYTEEYRMSALRGLDYLEKENIRRECMSTVFHLTSTTPLQMIMDCLFTQDKLSFTDVGWNLPK